MPRTMLQRFVLYQPRTCPRRSPCNYHSLLQICTCLQHKLCMFLCRCRHHSLRHKCMRTGHCSEEVSSSSRHIPCKMPQRFVLSQPRTCPHRSPCTEPILSTPCTFLHHNLRMFHHPVQLSPRCRCNSSKLRSRPASWRLTDRRRMSSLHRPLLL